MITSKDLVIIGVMPPPIGGISIHIQRLTKYLQDNNYSFMFVDYKKTNLFIIIRAIISSRLVHFHTSNPILSALFVFISFCLKKKSILTIHGEYDTYSVTLNKINIIAFKLASVIIVLNRKTYENVIKYTKHVVQYPAFIPPPDNFINSSVLKRRILELRSIYKTIYCTNASRFYFDKNGNEIYGIIELISIFRQNKNLFLFVSDPSNTYKNYFSQNINLIPQNVLIVSDDIFEFTDIVKHSDCLIRATTTDGDSLSVKEALYFNKKVIASNCVDRVPNVILYDNLDFNQLQEKILSIDTNCTTTPFELSNAAELIVKLYSKLLS